MYGTLIAIHKGEAEGDVLSLEGAMHCKRRLLSLEGFIPSKANKAAKGKEQYAQLLSLAVIPCIG